jgi:hypothetical protein
MQEKLIEIINKLDAMTKVNIWTDVLIPIIPSVFLFISLIITVMVSRKSNRIPLVAKLTSIRYSSELFESKLILRDYEDYIINTKLKNIDKNNHEELIKLQKTIKNHYKNYRDVDKELFDRKIDRARRNVTDYYRRLFELKKKLKIARRKEVNYLINTSDLSLFFEVVVPMEWAITNEIAFKRGQLQDIKCTFNDFIKSKKFIEFFHRRYTKKSVKG